MILLDNISSFIGSKRRLHGDTLAGDTEFQDTLPPGAGINKNPLMGDDLFPSAGSRSTQEWATKSVEKVIATQEGATKPIHLSSVKKSVTPRRPQFGSLNANIPYLTGLHMYQFEEGKTYTFYNLQDALEPTLSRENIQPQIFTAIREYRDGDTGKGYVKFRGSDGTEYALQPKGLGRDGVLRMSTKNPKTGEYTGKLPYLLADIDQPV